MAQSKEPEDMTLRLLREIRATLAEHGEKLEPLEQFQRKPAPAKAGV